MDFHKKLDTGTVRTVRGVVKCWACDWWQSWISQNLKTSRVVGPIRNSRCRKCGRRNRWHIQPDYKPHGNAEKYRCISFKKFDSGTPRVELNEFATQKNSKITKPEGFKLGTEL